MSDTYALSPDEITAYGRTMLEQIGAGQLAAISGLRATISRYENGNPAVMLPVTKTWRVEVELVLGRDLYTVRRVRMSKGERIVVGEITHVFCEDLGECCYQASCYVNVDFGDQS